MGVYYSRADSLPSRWHKCHKSGGKRKPYHKKRKSELGFMMVIRHMTRITDVIYNASSNELVQTKTLVKNCIILIVRTLYQQWYEAHYALPLGHKKGIKLTPEEEEILNKMIQKKYDKQKKNPKISSILRDQFHYSLVARVRCKKADGRKGCAWS
uniref:Small ribosomal subunit protein eS8 n=2 Tax=Gopherus TaxID=38771 RepID=A0A8C4YIU6_9SAUR